MFGFLKKKLKDAVDKISGVAKAEELAAESMEDAEKEVEIRKELKEEVKEKEKLIREAGLEVTPEIEEAIEKPEKQILEKTPREEIKPEEKELEEQKMEKKLEEAIIKGQPEAEEKAVKEKTRETEKPAKKKSLLGRLGIKKQAKAKEVPAQHLPAGFGLADEEKKEEEKEKTTLFKKIKKAISEKSLEESDIKDILWDLQIGLIENDVAVGAAEKIAADLRSALVGRSIPKKGIEETVKGSMKGSIREILGGGEISLEEKIKSKKPFLILFLGFNGVGKTTTIARVGHLLKEKGISCIFAAADTWRAGAIQQIEEHGERLGIKVIKQKYGSDPAAIIFDAKKYAEVHGIDAILADTAGRSHTNVNLVDELKKICRVNGPDMKVLVLDALTGNDVVEQTRYFNDAVGADAIIITKADVYEKGGSILSAAHTIKKPILYLGVGQGYKDLKEFDAEKVAESLLE